MFKTRFSLYMDLQYLDRTLHLTFDWRRRNAIEYSHIAKNIRARRTRQRLFVFYSKYRINGVIDCNNYG